MDIFLQQIVNGLTLGSVYALVALGYTMVYGIIQLINFAHGEVVMIGAMVAFTVINALRRRRPAAARDRADRRRCARSRCACWSATRWSASPTGRCARAPRLAPLITAIGVSIILQHLAMMIWSRNIARLPADHPQSRPSPSAAPPSRACRSRSSRSASLMMGGLALLVYRTPLGTAMRATAQNPQVAGLMGVDINRVIAVTFVIGAALGAVAGVMVGTYYGIAHYTMGFMLGLKAFSAAVLGGIGNIAGAMLGGLLLGVIEASARATSATSPTCASYGWIAGAAARALRRRRPLHPVRHQLPGRVRLPRADPGAGVPPAGPARRARGRPGVMTPARDARTPWRSGSASR